MFFVAWQLGYLHRLAHHGIDIADADRMVGTSAGSIVAANVSHGRLGEMFLESRALSLTPSVMGVLFPGKAKTPLQQAALDRYYDASDAEPATILAIGRGAREADAPGPETMSLALAVVVGEEWEEDALWMTAVDTGTGERCVLTKGTGVSLAHGAAASSAVPGIFSPQPVAGRLCMDGGVCGTGVHLDLLAGAEKALVLSLYQDADLHRSLLTLQPGDLTRETDALRAGGTDVRVRAPEQHPMDVAGIMDPKKVPDAMRMGARQADADAGDIARFWN
jgi:NTE family protein